MEYIARMYEVLWEYIEFPTFNDPKVSFIGYDDAFDCNKLEAITEIENAAQAVRSHWGLGNGPIQDIQYILEKNGILVTGFHADTEKIDAFSQRTTVSSEDINIIAIALGSKSEARIRFDLVHELAHIILHPWSEDLELISRETLI